MYQMVMTLRRRMIREDGQDLLEYSLLVALIALVVVGSVVAVGSVISNALWNPIIAGLAGL
jgi:Flp pilus assembly pilin Flp